MSRFRIRERLSSTKLKAFEKASGVSGVAGNYSYQPIKVISFCFK